MPRLKRNLHPLAVALLALLTKEKRVTELQDRYSAAAGRKRTTIIHAQVLPQAEATLPVKDITETRPANMGNSVWGMLTKGLLTRAAIYQGNLGDCYLLATILGLLQIDPNFFDDIFIPCTLPDGTPGVIVQYVFRGYIVRITTTLEVSTQYNNPNDLDIRVELLEKTYGFLRSGIADIMKDSIGSGVEAGAAFGCTYRVLQASERTVAIIDAITRAGAFMTFITNPTTKQLVAGHCYTSNRVLFASIVGKMVLINPWFGDKDDVQDIVALTNGDVGGIYVLNIPAVRVLKAPIATSPEVPVLDALFLDFTDPSPGGDPLNIIVNRPVGTPIKLVFTTNADAVVMTTPGINPTPITLPLAPNSYISAIQASARTFTYTATRAADGAKIIKTVTLVPQAVIDPNPVTPALQGYGTRVWRDGVVVFESGAVPK
jgi:calpain family cysteine protease